VFLLLIVDLEVLVSTSKVLVDLVLLSDLSASGALGALTVDSVVDLRVGKGGGDCENCCGYTRYGGSSPRGLGRRLSLKGI
jgi:hypothetical protein